jgi:TPR repeat protein
LSAGQDHAHDLSKAAKLLRQSAAAGFVPAMQALGLLLTNHPELADSREEARPLLEAAANAGSWKSSVVLGILARDGVGDMPGPEAAYYHFQIAILQGGEPAKDLLSNDMIALTGKLDEQRRAALTSKAASWFSEHKTVAIFVFKDSKYAKRFPASALAAPQNGAYAGILQPAPAS